VTPRCALGVTSRTPGAAGGLELLFSAVLEFVDFDAVELVSVGPVELLKP
jgi:hypothetical protein